MLRGALDTWLWLLFPTGAALVGFAFFGAAKAWSRWSKNRETTSPVSSLPAQVRSVRKIKVQLQTSPEHFGRQPDVEGVRVDGLPIAFPVPLHDPDAAATPQ